VLVSPSPQFSSHKSQMSRGQWRRRRTLSIIMKSSHRVFLTVCTAAVILNLVRNGVQEQLSVEEATATTTVTATMIHQEPNAPTTTSTPSRSDSAAPFVEPTTCQLGAAFPILNASSGCAMFYPAQFFSNDTVDTIRYERGFRRNRATFKVDGNPVIHLKRDDDATEQGIPESTSYLHIRKVGGSTMHYAFRKTKESSSSSLKGLHLALSWKMRNHQMGQIAYQRAWDEQVRHIMESQHAATTRDSTAPPVVFTYVRCPVERFLSATAQILKNPSRYQRWYR